MARFLITLLGSSKQNCDWHIFTVSILLCNVILHLLKDKFIQCLKWSARGGGSVSGGWSRNRRPLGMAWWWGIFNL